MPNKSAGVYTITSTKTGKVYVGSTTLTSIASRWWGHRTSLRRNKHENAALQAAWNEEGEAGFVFEILHACEPDFAKDFEQYWMNALRAWDSDYGYNKSPNAKTVLGCKYPPRSAATRAKMSASHIARRTKVEALEAAAVCRKEAAAAAAEREVARIYPAEVRRQMAMRTQKGALVATNLADGEKTIYETTGDAIRAGFNQSGIYNVIAGKAHSHKGFRWERLAADRKL